MMALSTLFSPKKKSKHSPFIIQLHPFQTSPLISPPNKNGFPQMRNSLLQNAILFLLESKKKIIPRSHFFSFVFDFPFLFSNYQAPTSFVYLNSCSSSFSLQPPLLLYFGFLDNSAEKELELPKKNYIYFPFSFSPRLSPNIMHSILSQSYPNYMSLS